MTYLYNVYDLPENVDKNVYIYNSWKTIVCEAVFTLLDCIICAVCRVSELAVAFWEVCMENMLFYVDWLYKFTLFGVFAKFQKVTK
jgi:hypothetical protein